MKIHILLFGFLFFTNFGFAQIVNIPDPAFKDALVNMTVANLTPSSYVAGELFDVYSVVDTNGDGEIQVSEAESIYGLHFKFTSNYITSIEGIEFFTNLEYLSIEFESVTSIDLSNNLGLKFLSCWGNELNQIDLSNNTLLEFLEIKENTISSLDISMLINLKVLNCSDNPLTVLNTSFNTNLENLYCQRNQLTNIDISQNVNLKSLFCYQTPLTSLDLSQNINLNWLYCRENQLTSLDLSNNSNLTNLNCGNNNLTSIDVSNLVNLVSLSARGTQLQEIDLSNNLALEELDLSANNINDLDLSNLQNLEVLDVAGNELTSVDISYCPNINQFEFDYNPLTSLNIKNGSAYIGFLFGNVIWQLPLEHICADDNEVFSLQSYLNSHDYDNIVANSYCSFSPGGDYFTIEGEHRVDTNTNGCDINDIFYPNFHLSITDGSNSGTYFVNDSGNYNIPVIEGTHTLTTVLENTDYFTVSPNSATVTFPDDGNSFTQDFCISPNGVHNDVEVVIVPLVDAIPGFDSEYEIIYRNKGNTILSGTIDFDFEDDYMDFLSANPMETIESLNNLQWNYTNLQPFETREIEVSFNLNTPTDSTFPLNDGDALNFAVAIDPIAGDETESDNTFGLKQIIVNSYDPNDIRCLEGRDILSEHVGKYVHYLIRFENLGTANAVNVVVKDIIDTSKFDVSTLIPLNASHNYTTRIREGNIVEFIFENIQLPFDDANNDGYVVFKIKTLETLQLGDTFTNQAEIYFDFNFPIITNIYSTEVQRILGVSDFEFGNVRLYPNPANDVVTISSNVTIDTVKIFDINGRLVLSETLDQFTSENRMKIKDLTSGIYFIELQSETTKETLKFIKK